MAVAVQRVAVFSVRVSAEKLCKNAELMKKKQKKTTVPYMYPNFGRARISVTDRDWWEDAQTL